MKWSKVTHVGRVRSINEDYACARPDLGLFAVADGMGGHQAGEVASKKAIEFLEKEVEDNLGLEMEPEKTLQAAIERTNELIYNSAYNNVHLRGMGTTITACRFRQRMLTVAHVGDSRCYLIRENNIYRLTRDHSLVEEMVQQNQITAREAQYHPYRNVLTRALGTSPRVQVDVSKHNLSYNDIILLCTDGVTAHLSDMELAGYVQDKEPEKAVREILNEVLVRGGSDNITIVMVAVR